MEALAIDEYLSRAACSEEVRAQMAQLVESGHAEEGLPALARHRVQLLGELREADNRLFCLDRVIAEITGTTGA